LIPVRPDREGEGIIYPSNPEPKAIIPVLLLSELLFVVGGCSELDDRPPLDVVAEYRRSYDEVRWFDEGTLKAVGDYLGEEVEE
jgi:hypothetical protein